MMKARELGVTVDEKSAQTRAILARIKKLEKDGYEFEAADASFELLVRRSLEKIPAPFQIESYEVKVVRSDLPPVRPATPRLPCASVKKYKRPLPAGMVRSTPSMLPCEKPCSPPSPPSAK